MTLLRNGLTGLALLFSANGALAIVPERPPWTQANQPPSPSTAWKPVKLCNGISKHTRTICCGAHPPGWCGKPQDAVAVAAAHLSDTTVSDGKGIPSPLRTSDDILFILRDPMFYLCMLTVITVIYLSAQAATGRDREMDGDPRLP